ncbi:hypothetical protein [Acrocarpospora catenulata]|uniref:hypothetical protein n=1 Tax=Acrocarpospora catenulata TaxID=2836182 RepID=UPI001BDB0241|nr:hypothetical protein [Acrocarpospora catenulata]
MLDAVRLGPLTMWLSCRAHLTRGWALLALGRPEAATDHFRSAEQLLSSTKAEGEERAAWLWVDMANGFEHAGCHAAGMNAYTNALALYDL